jgi:plastocyanin
MKYLKRYERFVNENVRAVVKNIDKELMIVEKQVLNDFSGSFWDMSLRSKVFTEEEKSFIKENLLSVKVDLVNEGWLSDTLTGVWDKAKEVGGKIWDKVKSKITAIKENIKNLCSGIAEFVKSFFKSIGEGISTKAAAMKEKAKQVFPEKIEEVKKTAKDEELGSELQQLTSTYTHLSSSVKSGLFVKNVDAADDGVIKDAESQVGELESELKAESLNHDILDAFYIYEAEEVEYKVGDKVKYKMKDGGEAEKEIVKVEGDNIFFKDKDGNEFSKPKSDILPGSGSAAGKVWGGFAKWFLDMEEATPPEKGKAVWWIKLILKVVALILSPIVKALEVAVKFVSSNILKGASAVSKYLNGPGVFEFLILGGIVAGIPALITEFSLVSHKMPDPYSHIFEIVSHFLAEAAGFETLITIFGAICTAMTFAQLVTEFKHLFGHGHGEHGEEHGKEGQVETPTKPGAPAKPGTEKPAQTEAETPAKPGTPPAKPGTPPAKPAVA